MKNINKFLLVASSVLFFAQSLKINCEFNFVERKFSNSGQCLFGKELTAPRDVQRWHASHKSNDKSKIYPKMLSSHLLDSSWFTYLLVSVHNDLNNDSLDPYRCALLASFHDYLEVYTGDILSTTKSLDPEMKKLCTKAEKYAYSNFIESVPEKLKKPLRNALYIFIKGKLSDEEKKILNFIKFSDLMSAYFECLEELEAGNKEFLEPSKYLQSEMKDLATRDVSMEYFYNLLFPTN